LREPIGFFVNTLPIRAQLSHDMRFDALVTNLKQIVTTIFDLQSYPGANLNADLGLGAQPLFRQLFALQPDRRGLRLGSARCQRFGAGTGTAKVDLAFLVFPDGDELEVLVEYRPAAVTSAQVGTLLNAWRVLLERALEMPATPLGELPLLTTPMRDQSVQWSGTERARLGFEECLPDLVARWARETPSKIAARDTTGRMVTYGELWDVSSRVACALQQRGIGPGSRVGLDVERSVDTPALLLGILRTGAAYVTLEGGALTDTAFLDLLIAPRAKDHATTTPQALLRAPEQSPRPVALSPADAACLFFTSGTTGCPKGAVIPHRAIVRLVKSPKFARFDAATIQLQLAPPAFDASTLELWGPLANGGTVVFAPGHPLSPGETVRLMEAERINMLWLTAGLFHLFADLEEPWLAGVRTLMVGGDVISPLKARKVLQRFPHLRLINGYGPTENTTFTCCHPTSLADLDGNSIPLGTPICGTEVWVLGSSGELLPPGCIGEICAGGDGLFLGYTADNENPPAWSVAHPEGRGILYRTGDYGYWNETGSLIFCGRRDRQVKVRGFRVELDAVERQLGALPGVSQVAVQVDRSELLHPVIVAHYVKASTAPSTESDLLRAARTVLPAWQVPTRWINHAALPLTGQGKIDRGALLQRSRGRVPNGLAPGAFENSVERAIAEIWQDVIGNGPFTAHTNFFAAGGDSLLALRATLEIEAYFGVPIPLRLLFQASTPRALAECLSRRETIPDFRHLVPLRVTNISEGIPLFFIHGWSGSLFHLLPLIQQLSPHIPVYGLQGDPETAHGRKFEHIVADYVQEIRKFRPHGPWFIAGYSLGGLIAHETARQLTGNGEVARLFLLDSFPHNLPPLRYWAMKIFSEGTRGVKLFAPVIRHPIKTLRQPGTVARLARISLIGFRRLTGDNSIAPTPYDQSMERLVPRPFESRAVLFLAMKSIRPLQFGWRHLVRGPLDIERLPVSHGSMIGNERGLLAAALATHYDRYSRSFSAAATTLRD
jgi:amino acid adenylation domain-containing protein